MMESMSAKLLIVDDEKRMCAILREALAAPGLAVTTAGSGEAAWAALSLERYDVIVSDIKMTGMSGVELLKKVKAAKDAGRPIKGLDDETIAALQTLHA